MGLNVQVGDLVQCRLKAGATTYVDVREVLNVDAAGDLMVAGGLEGRPVSRHDVLCAFSVEKVCQRCFCRPCDCCFPEGDLD